MIKCRGCGSFLQTDDKDQIGYVKRDVLNPELCERCFRIQHYNEYQVVTKSNHEFLKLLNQIKLTGDLVLLLVDLFQMNQDIRELVKDNSKNVLLVFTKRDLLPLSLSNQKIKEYKDILEIDCIDITIISSKKNNGLDELMSKIKTYQTSKYVYIVGYTNAGKSTLLNHMLKNYAGTSPYLTTSMMPSTTLSTIEIPISDELVLVDTPGILEEGNFINLVEGSTLKKILPKKEIKPITYQIKTKQWITIDEFVIVISENNNLTFFFSNQLKIERWYHQKEEKHLNQKIIQVEANEDIVILGLGFIKCMKKECITIYVPNNVAVFTRKSLI